MAIVNGIQFSQLVKGMLRMVLLECGSRNRKFHRLTIFLAATGLLALFAAGVLEGNSQDRSGPFSQAREKIVSLIEEKKVPSLSLAVVRNGEIIWEEAFGLANLEKKIKATPETFYPIASATKPFTATALMILVERGLVDLDKSANTYLGKVKLRSFQGDASEATVRRILHHTSGLPMYWNFYFAGKSRQRPPLETTLQRYGLLVSKPGQSYNYSNLGYAVLEALIEHVSGKPYPEFLEAEVLNPLNLRHTAVQTTAPENPNVAEKYAPSLAPIPFCDQDTRGAGGIYATAHDLALFCLLHLGRLRPDQKAILKPESIAAMQRTRDPDGHNSSYALGWETGRRFGYLIITHGGVMDGCRAHLAMVPSEGLAAAVLINGENIPSIQVCDWIFGALLPEYARNMKAASKGGSPPSPQTFNPPAEIVGTWKGTIITHEGDIPVCLIVESNGRVELARLDQPGKGYSPLKTPVLNQRLFVAHFPQVFSLSDAPSASHRTVLGLTIRENRLSGEANTIASDMSYSLPSYIELKRAEKNCPQVIYEGNYVESIDGSVIISTKILSDNRTPGLSGSPVIDSNGCLVGIMSQKYGQMEKLGSIQYPERIIEAKFR
jgi:CubicO group peptidase (beta-lactamase class C family)